MNGRPFLDHFFISFRDSMHSADYAVARYMSVCSSHAGILLKRLNISSLPFSFSILSFPTTTPRVPLLNGIWGSAVTHICESVWSPAAIQFLVRFELKINRTSCDTVVSKIFFSIVVSACRTMWSSAAHTICGSAAPRILGCGGGDRFHRHHELSAYAANCVFRMIRLNKRMRMKETKQCGRWVRPTRYAPARI